MNSCRKIINYKFELAPFFGDMAPIIEKYQEMNYELMAPPSFTGTAWLISFVLYEEVEE